jgi:pyridoxamine 5'-phosphate oxidase
MSDTQLRPNDMIFDDSYFGAIEPIALFADWLAAARQSEVNDPTAMALSTVDADGMPDVRMVLLNGLDDRGFVFYTNYGSAKGQQLLNQPKAALLFHWKSLRRQVRIRGDVEQVSPEEADAYFHQRPAQSRIGAHASIQSQPLADRLTLEGRAQKLAEHFDNKQIPRPEYWSGFRVLPRQIEFWKDGAYRLHDRVVLHREGDIWSRTRLYP